MVAIRVVEVLNLGGKVLFSNHRPAFFVLANQRPASRSKSWGFSRLWFAYLKNWPLIGWKDPEPPIAYGGLSDVPIPRVASNFLKTAMFLATFLARVSQIDRNASCKNHNKFSKILKLEIKKD